MTTFSGFETAAAGLRAAQRGLDVTGQNLANATTPGYVRRRVNQLTVGETTATPSITMPPPRGSGSVDTSVTRLGDTVLDSRWRVEAGLNESAADTKAAFDSLESTFDEPSDTGLAARLDSLWNGFADAANGGGAATVLGAANSAVDWLHDASNTLAGQVDDAKATLANTVAQAQHVVNNLAQTNAAIIAAHNAGQDTADLEDVRDKYADQLATMLGATTSLGPSGEATVTLAGSALVSRATPHVLAVGSDGVSLTLDGSAVASPSGTAAAAIATATVTVPGYQAKLDGVANALRDQVNSALTAANTYDANGNPGTALFSGSGAAGLTVALSDPSQVALSSGGPGNTAVAAQLSQQGAQSGAPDALYRGLVSGLGVDSARAANLADTRAAATNSIQQARLSAEGVSTDEETMNLLTYQRNYQAAARVLTTLDDALDTLINHTGRVGL